jgi:hypothetical protein
MYPSFHHFFISGGKRLYILESSMSGKTYDIKPGEIASASGQYQEIGPRGRKGHEVTVVKGERMPPTTLAGSSYKIVDRTKNKSGQA